MNTKNLILLVFILIISSHLFAQNDTLSFEFGPADEADTWERVSFTLTAETFGVTTEEFDAAMANITMIRIQTRMAGGEDKCGIDQVAMGATFLSTFDDGTEEWSSMGDGTLAWNPENGVDGGLITVSGRDNNNPHWAVAPVSWSGDLSDLIGQSFSFYYKTNNPGDKTVVEFYSGEVKRIILLPEVYTLNEGETGQVTVSLSSEAENDVTVTLNNTQPDLISVPSEVIIPAGETSAKVTIEASHEITELIRAIISATAADYETTQITIRAQKNTIRVVTLLINGPEASARLNENEKHRYEFEVTENGKYSIETQGNTDLYMVLFENDAVTRIATDDDSGEGGNAKITMNLAPGIYKVKITGFNNSETGDYTIDVKTVQGEVAVPDILSVEYGPPAAADTWERVSFALTAETFGVTTEEFNTAMANITMIRIQTRMNSGTDKCGIDLVAMGTTFLSTFDEGTEGWSSMGDGTLAWNPNNGVDGGLITVSGRDNNNLHGAVAPIGWSGDLSVLNGQSFSFYYKTNNPGNKATVEFHTRETKRILLSPEVYTMNAGDSDHVKVSLSSPPEKEVAVTLNSTRPDLISVPSEVSIPAGEISAQATIEASEEIMELISSVISAVAAGYKNTQVTIRADKDVIPVITLTVDGPEASSTLNENEKHRYIFEVTKNGKYTIETHGGTDLYMVLFENDAVTRIATDDDSGEGSNARITVNLAPGMYKLRINGFNNSESGEYLIDVKTVQGEVVIPDILSVEYGPAEDTISWERISFSLTAETFGVTAEEFNAAMANITMIRIQTRMAGGADKYGIDQVAMGASFLSTFDDGMEEWSSMGDGTLAWNQDNGVYGGLITIRGRENNNQHWAVTPVSWSGDLSALAGQTFSFYYKTNNPGDRAVVEFHTRESKRILLIPEFYTLSAGETMQLSVDLSMPSEKDVTISFSSSKPEIISVPSDVTIPAGHTSASVTIAASQNIGTGDLSVITASASDYESTRVTIHGDEEITANQEFKGRKNLIVYPNPTKGRVFIKVENHQNDIQVSVFSLSGKKVLQKHFSGMPVELDLTRNFPGMYILQILAGRDSYFQKIILTD